MPSPLEQLLSADDLRDVGTDQLKKRMLMQMLLQNPVAEGHVDPTSPYTLGNPNRPTSAVGGILPDRSGDNGMAFKPGGGPQRMAPRDQGLSVGLISNQGDDPRVAALEQLKKAMADRHEAWLIDHMSTQGRRAQDISDSFQPPRPRVGPYPPQTLLDLLKGR